MLKHKNTYLPVLVDVVALDNEHRLLDYLKKTNNKIA